MISKHESDMLIASYAPPPYKVDKKRVKSRYDIGKRIKFRCDFPSTQLKVMLTRGWVQVEDGAENTNDWNLWWCEINEVRLALDRKLLGSQKIPHFRNHYELTRKNYLCRNLKRYKKLLIKEGKTLEAKLCECMPVTFELPNEYHMLVEEYHRQGGTWIVKPVGGSQGKGIFLFKKLKDLVDWKNKESDHRVPGESAGAPETFVVQKYVDDPYLLAGRKFDLRIYVLVTSFNPLKVWLAREGFARLSGQLFDLENIEDSRVHLTNMSIQLKVDSNGSPGRSGNPQAKQGCKWALHSVREYLTARHGVKVMDKLLQRIAGVITASLQSVKMVIMQGRNSFELYGYDILLDEHLTPWLLEVNASPALAPTDDEDYRLKFDLLDDVLTVLDFERILTGNETRVGGFDLLWDDGPIWTSCPGMISCGSKTPGRFPGLQRLNIFLGSYNDRVSQLRELHEELNSKRIKKRV